MSVRPLATIANLSTTGSGRAAHRVCSSIIGENLKQIAIDRERFGPHGDGPAPANMAELTAEYQASLNREWQLTTRLRQLVGTSDGNELWSECISIANRPTPESEAANDV